MLCLKLFQKLRNWDWTSQRFSHLLLMGFKKRTLNKIINTSKNKENVQIQKNPSGFGIPSPETHICLSIYPSKQILNKNREVKTGQRP